MLICQNQLFLYRILESIFVRLFIDSTVRKIRSTLCLFYQNTCSIDSPKYVTVYNLFLNKETKLRIHNITAKAALKFGSEAWVLKKREEQRLEAAQMKFLRRLLGITKLDKEKNQCIREKTGAQSIVKEIKQYQKEWLQHVQRMDTNRLPKQALQYRPKGRRNMGRPRKRWRDQLHLEV